MKKRELRLDGFRTAQDGNFTLCSLELSTPEYRSVTQEVPGMDGALDFADAPDGRVHFKTRTLKAALECSHGSRAERRILFDALIRKLNGRRVQIGHPDYSGRHLLGRVQITEKFNLISYGRLELTAVCEPWLYSDAPTAVSLPLLGRSENALKNVTATLMEALSDCDTTTFSNAASLSATARILTGAARSKAVWRLALSANHDYYIAGRIMQGSGIWGAAASADEAPKHGYIRTGADGYLYFTMQMLSTVPLTISPLIVTDAANVRSVDNGAAPAVATAKTPQCTVSACIGINGTVSVFSSGATVEMDIPSGPVELLSFTQADQETAMRTALRWTRGDL